MNDRVKLRPLKGRSLEKLIYCGYWDSFSYKYCQPKSGPTEVGGQRGQLPHSAFQELLKGTPAVEITVGCRRKPTESLF